MNSRLVAACTFSFAIAIGAAAAVASQGAATRHVAPAIHEAPVEVIRLDPVVVTVSRAWFEAARAGKPHGTQLASDTVKTSRGG